MLLAFTLASSACQFCFKQRGAEQHSFKQMPKIYGAANNIYAEITQCQPLNNQDEV